MKKIMVTMNDMCDEITAKCCNLEDTRYDFVGQGVTYKCSVSNKETLIFISDDGDLVVETEHDTSVRKVTTTNADGEKIEVVAATYIDLPDTAVMIRDGGKVAVDEDLPEDELDANEDQGIEIGDIVNVAEEGEPEDLREVIDIVDGAPVLSDKVEEDAGDDEDEDDNEEDKE